MLNHFGYQAGPSSLMIRTEAGAIVSMKKFVKKNEVAPVGIALEYLGVSVNRAAAVIVAQKNMGEPASYFRRHLPEIRLIVRTSGTWQFEIFAIVVMVFLQGFDQ